MLYAFELDRIKSSRVQSVEYTQLSHYQSFPGSYALSECDQTGMFPEYSKKTYRKTLRHSSNDVLDAFGGLGSTIYLTKGDIPLFEKYVLSC